MQSNGSFYIIIGALGIALFFIFSDIGEMRKTMVANSNALVSQTIEIKAIAGRLDVTDRDRLYEVRAKRNQEVLGDISCGKCHNAETYPLPIRNITIREAIEIVRKGNDRSIEGGMPLYSAINNGRGAHITDSGLQMRLEKLYTQELIKIALDRDYNAVVRSNR